MGRLKKFIRIVLEIFSDAISNAIYAFEQSVRYIPSILNLILPYLMLFLGQYLHAKRGYKDMRLEVFIPLAFWLVIKFFQSFANKIGKGSDIPLPRERFTETDEDGEVSIEKSRLQELIIYTNNLEDWLERKGLL